MDWKLLFLVLASLETAVIPVTVWEIYRHKRKVTNGLKFEMMYSKVDEEYIPQLKRNIAISVLLWAIYAAVL